MPPKAKPTSTHVYVVLSGNTVDSVHASVDSANERVSEAGSSFKVEVQELVGGSVTVDKKAAAAAKPKPKTKSAAEQRAANANKGSKGDDEDLPENVKVLLGSSSTKLEGLIMVVTGVPPTLGRKNADKLVQVHGGKLGKSITGKTNYVVVGNDAGPKKLEEIEKHGITALDEDEFIEMLEIGGPKREADDDDEDEDEKPVKAKKQKK